MDNLALDKDRGKSGTSFQKIQTWSRLSCCCS